MSTFKTKVINKPAFYFSEQNYFRYILLLSWFLSFFGRAEFLRTKKVESKLDDKRAIWVIQGKTFKIMIQSQYRISRFLRGFMRAGERQWTRYGIDSLLGHSTPDVLIDVGANIGEVSFFADKTIRTIFALEPDPIAFECLQFNMKNTNVKCNQVALGEINGKVRFFSQPHSADSSLFRPDGEFNELSVTCLTLDKFFEEEIIHGNVLLKMDAEGFEPEILRSGKHALKKIKWVAIDAGAERDKETTFAEVVDILTETGFSRVEVSPTNIVTAWRH